MKKVFTISIIMLFLYSTAADAQRWITRRWEAYAGIGTANHYGDIGGAQISSENLYGLKDFQIKFTRPSIAGGGKYKINNRMYARVNLAAAFLEGNDLDTENMLSGAENGIGRKGGYKFKSLIFEPSAMYEFYFLPEARSLASNALYNRSGMINGFGTLNLYGFVGVGGVVNFPTVSYINTGEEVPADDGYQLPDAEFSRIGLAIPFGLGVRFGLTSYWTINVELGRRYTFTDYVDGYTSKFSDSADLYDFVNVIFSYKIRTDKNGLPVIFKRTTGLR